jgi:glycosyltransferase involved in cell wall biosynthesis
MRIRVLHCLWHGEIGGAERAVEQLVAAQLRDPDLEPALLFGQAGGLYWSRARELGCPVVTLGLPHGRALTRVRSSADAMAGFDIHHFHSPEVSLMLSSVLCRGVRRVYTHRGGVYHYSRKARMRNAIAGVLLRRHFHAFSGNTGHAAWAAIELFGLPPKEVRLTYNGLDFGLLRPTRDAGSVRADLGIAPSSFVIGTAANLKPWKRIERLVEAVRKMGDARSHLLIVGDGVDRPRLERSVAESGLRRHVSFVGAQANVADYLQVMDAFCLPSAGLESFGNAVVEAMALGLPSLIFDDGGGMVEHIDDGRTGFIVRDETELVRRLETLRDNPEFGRSVGAAAKASVRERYTPERSLAAYRDLYDAALTSAPASTGRHRGRG